MRTTGNTIFLPGGTSGIGRGLAERFAARGDRVIVGGRRQELLDEIAAGHDRIESVRIDMSDAASIREVSAAVQERFPETNVLLACAGIMHPEDVTGGGFLESAEATVATNLLGPIRLWAAWAPFLVGKPDAALITVSPGSRSPRSPSPRPTTRRSRPSTRSPTPGASSSPERACRSSSSCRRPCGPT